MSFAIGVPKIGTLCALHKPWRATYGFKSTNWGINPTGDAMLSALEQAGVQVFERSM
jgi:hypothetical protein